ncbi:MAG: pirin family protein, partial [Rhodospirillaceae bacterium]
NEDKVTPGTGFDTHGHANMEIISYVLDGALEHKDTLGTGEVIRPGEVQRMTAGRGIRHSEFNHSKTDPVHFLQIWILPEQDGLSPSYEQRNFPTTEKRGKLRLVGSADGRDGSVKIHQDVNLYAGLFDADEQASLPIEAGRIAWVQVARGDVTVNGQTLSQGDGLAIRSTDKIDVSDGKASEILIFDMVA